MVKMINQFQKLSFNIKRLGNPRWDTQVTPPELLEFIKEKSPGRVLDLG
jgi:hypothetical protein